MTPGSNGRSVRTNLLYLSDRALGAQAVPQSLTERGFAVTHAHSADDAAMALRHLSPDVVLVETLSEHLHAALRSMLDEHAPAFLLVSSNVEALPSHAALQFAEIVHSLACLRRALAMETPLHDRTEVVVTDVSDGQMLLRVEVKADVATDAHGRQSSMFRLLAMLFGATLQRRSLDALREQLRLDVRIRSEATGSRLHRVLLVDDHEDSRELFREHLELLGYDVVAAEDGRDALALLMTRSFDVALLDISLPGLDGLEVARRTRRQLGSGPPMLIAITGHARDADRDAAHLAGFDVHLSKPVDARAVMALIESRVGARR